MSIRSSAVLNVPLTSYAYGIMQDNLAAYRLANLLCPIVQVGPSNGTFKIYDDRNAFLVEPTHRGLGGTRKRIKQEATDGTYNCDPYGLEIAQDDFEQTIAGGNVGPDQTQIKIKNLLSRKATSYSNEVTQFVFANVTPVAGRGNWSNPDIDPIDQIDEQLDALSAVVGTTENINVVMSVGEWRTLRTNDKVKKRLGITGGLTLKREQLVDGLLFPVNLEVSGVLSSTTKFGQSTVTKSRAMAGYCLITHSKPSPTTDDASAFKCFSTSSVLVDSVREYREESANSSIYAVDWSQQLKVTGSACIKALAIT